MKIILKENDWTNIPNHDKGWGNGYALIPKGHPFHGVEYDDIPVNVHGGLTFGRLVDEEMVKHWPELSEEDIGFWMVGFDTMHYMDSKLTCPKEYVERETQLLALQLEALKTKAIENGK